MNLRGNWNYPTAIRFGAGRIRELPDACKTLGMRKPLLVTDPELTLGLPAPVTAAVGMDALSHNLEAYCSPFYHPMAEGIALEGMRLVRQWLPVAVHEGGNLEARSHMMVASSMGATAFQKGLGAMHSLSHPCSANLNTHHGLTNAVVMPYVLSWNRAAIDAKMDRLAAFLGLRQHSFDGVLDWILELRRTIGIPNTLAQLGLKDEHAGAFAQQAFDDPSTGGNPLPMTVEMFAALYRNCIEGTLRAAA